MDVINRSALIIYTKEKMLAWINQSALKDEEKITLEEVNAEPTVFLIPEFDDEEEAYMYVEKNKDNFFLNMLYGWTEDDINIEVEKENFHEWFDILITPIIVDMEKTKITKEVL